MMASEFCLSLAFCPQTQMQIFATTTLITEPLAHEHLYARLNPEGLVLHLQAIKTTGKEV